MNCSKNRQLTFVLSLQFHPPVFKPEFAHEDEMRHLTTGKIAYALDIEYF